MCECANIPKEVQWHGEEDCAMDKPYDYGVPFKVLFSDFVAGVPIKRTPWKGYWVYRYGKIEMHSKNNEVILFDQTKDTIFTVSHFTMEDWVVATPRNSTFRK